MLAFGLIPSESKQHCEWFINNMKNCGHQLSSFIAQEDLLCVTDRGTGLLSAIKRCLPQASRRYCYLHILKHIKNMEKGSPARKLFDNVVYATTLDGFWTSMNALQALRPDVHEYLNSIGFAMFAEAMMPEGVSHYQRTNNLAEQQMSWLGDCRSKPAVPFIVALIEKLTNKYLTESREYSFDKQAHQVRII
jgi:hypothetical protein